LETLRTLLEQGHLKRETDGRLVEAKREGLPVSQRVQDLIRTRLATLGEEQCRVLNAAAVIGRPFSLPLLRRVSGQPEPQLLDLVGQLLTRSFLHEKGEAQPHEALDFQHNYFRQVIYQGLSTVQRQALHRRVAQALLAHHRTRPPAITEEVAHHYEQAGDAQAIAYLVQAAQQAEGLFAFAHAVELYGRALALLQRYLADEPSCYFDVLMAREAVLDRQGRRAEQADDVATLVSLAGRLENPDRQASAYLRQAGLFARTGRHEAARQAGQRALALVRQGGDRAGEAQALRELGFLHWSAGDYGMALTYNRDALQLHRQLGDTSGEATALHNLAEIYRGLGSPRQALTQYEQALNLHWARQDQRRQGLTLYGMAHALRQMEQADQALARYRQALDLFQAVGDRLMASRVHHALAGLQWEAGALDQALQHMHQALRISQEIGYGSGIAHGLVTLSYLYAQCDEAATAREYLQEAITWLRLIEDQAGLGEAQTRLRALEEGTSEALDPPARMGWIKDHVALAEGKVYCEFESPMAYRQP
jgi:tetratricopeptide (TPR) repeat protein